MHDDDEDILVPAVDALLAGTLAAMTAWADPCPTCRMDPGTQRGLLARKVVSNLFFLQQHPAVGPALRQVMAQAHQRWVGVVQQGLAAVPAGPASTATATGLHLH